MNADVVKTSLAVKSKNHSPRVGIVHSTLYTVHSTQYTEQTWVGFSLPLAVTGVFKRVRQLLREDALLHQA
jgi:hypothetical protein